MNLLLIQPINNFYSNRFLSHLKMKIRYLIIRFAGTFWTNRFQNHHQKYHDDVCDGVYDVEEFLIIEWE